MGQESGYDCNHPDALKRIVDDSRATSHDWTSPSWCPLEDKNTLEIALHKWKMKHISK